MSNQENKDLNSADSQPEKVKVKRQYNKKSNVSANKETTRESLSPLLSKQVNGQLINKHNVDSIDELLGENRSQYQQNSEEEYEDFLNSLNTTDLRDHAVSLFIVPREDRDMLVRTLIKEYRIKTSKYLKSSRIQAVQRKPITPELEKILSEGR